jgi:hypothetical protein
MDRFTPYDRLPGEHCPICGHPRWCAVSDDKAVVMCMRVAEGAFSQRETGAGLAYFHRIAESQDRPTPARKPKPQQSREVPPKVPELAARARKAISADQLRALGYSLGLSPDALDRMGVGWSGWRAAWTFPMRAPWDGSVVGVRLRLTRPEDIARHGTTKISQAGSDGNGLFVPDQLNATGRLLCVCEGPTDCAALLDMGLEAVGRPSQTAGRLYLYWLIHRVRPSEVCIVADRDEPGSTAEQNTRRGAAALADSIARWDRPVRIIQPEGAKDVREWKAAGAMADDVFAAMEDAAPRRPRRHERLARLVSA